MAAWFDERLHVDKGYAQRFAVKRTLARERTRFQTVSIFETDHFGRVLALDGVIQTTEADEFVYHEMLTHVPMLAHGHVRDVLIVGGGDGGILREVLRHRKVRRAVMVEIDGRVVELCRRYLPTLNAGAFDDKRAEVRIGDGIAYVKDAPDGSFDLVIVDSTDPMGPGKVLFGDAFYRACKRILKTKGLVVTQNGVPFFQPGELTATRRRLCRLFADVRFYGAVVPSYAGGIMALGWASDHGGYAAVTAARLARRAGQAKLKTRYYSPAMHKAAFTLPPFIAGLAR
ncbi:MAG: polyamine aminopropyltransferase [Proteobacteria bacterium]|nr:polyamine aminopropyltransferase [Pseudomonadota bacterium]